MPVPQQGACQIAFLNGRHHAAWLTNNGLSKCRQAKRQPPDMAGVKRLTLSIS
jgi:hypothetical protein